MQPHMGMNAMHTPNGVMQPLQSGTGQGFGLMYMQPAPVGALPSTQIVPGMPNHNGPSFF